jgi:hypothetical protein
MFDLEHDYDGTGDISLLRYFTNRVLTEIDWQIVQALEEKPEHLPGLIHELDIVRQVAVIHAMFAIAKEHGAERGRYLRHVELGARLALRTAETWEEVEEAKDRWRALGISLTHGDLTYLAEFAEKAIP